MKEKGVIRQPDRFIELALNTALCPMDWSPCCTSCRQIAAVGSFGLTQYSTRGGLSYCLSTRALLVNTAAALSLNILFRKSWSIFSGQLDFLAVDYHTKYYNRLFKQTSSDWINYSWDGPTENTSCLRFVLKFSWQWIKLKIKGAAIIIYPHIFSHT